MIIMTQQSSGECRAPHVNNLPVQFILLSQNVGHYLINNIETCIQSLEDNPSYNRVNTFQHLVVYERTIN